MAGYVDVMINDEGMDLTAALRDLAGIGERNDIKKSQELFDKMDLKRFKKGNNKAPWIVGHLGKMMNDGFMSNTGAAASPAIDQDEIRSLVNQLGGDEKK